MYFILSKNQELQTNSLQLRFAINMAHELHAISLLVYLAQHMPAQQLQFLLQYISQKMLLTAEFKHFN